LDGNGPEPPRLAATATARWIAVEPDKRDTPPFEAGMHQVDETIAA
jgi:hypothetical protein